MKRRQYNIYTFVEREVNMSVYEEQVVHTSYVRTE